MTLFVCQLKVPSSRSYIEKIKSPNGDAHKVRFDTQMNVGHIVIDNAFGLL